MIKEVTETGKQAFITHGEQLMSKITTVVLGGTAVGTPVLNDLSPYQLHPSLVGAITAIFFMLTIGSALWMRVLKLIEIANENAARERAEREKSDAEIGKLKETVSTLEARVHTLEEENHQYRMKLGDLDRRQDAISHEVYDNE